MSLTAEKVRKIAKLSKIKLTDDEVDHFGKELSAIFDWIEVLDEVDTDDVLAMSSVSDVILPQRQDKVTDGDVRDDILANAPESQYGYFAVPTVVE